MPSLQWAPFAVRRIGKQGLSAKHGYPNGIQGVPSDYLMTAPKRGEIKHDSTGPIDATLGVLDNHPINSWQFTVGEDEIYQHYPVDANCWHGNDTDPDQDVRANTELVGVEHVRAVDNVTGKPRPLSPRQVELTTQLTAWLQETRGRPVATRFGPDTADAEPEAPDVWLLCEHGEVGNSWTECPSGRIPWDLVLAGLSHEEGDDVLKHEVDKASGLEFLYLYNGPVPIRRYGSTMRTNGVDERAGREALNFGDKWLWQRHFTDEGVFDAAGFLSEVEGD